MNGYVRSEELAERWNVSERQIQVLCKAGRIKGAVKFGNTWAIPEDAMKPTRTGNQKPGRKPKKVREKYEPEGKKISLAK